MTKELINIAAFLMEKIESKKSSANDIINNYTKTHRYIESKMRADLLALVWGVIRAYYRLNYAYPTLNWVEKITLFIEKGVPDIKDAPDNVLFEVPEWIISHVPDAKNELPAMLGIAPIVLRANGNRDNIQKMLADEGVITHKTTLSPYGLILQSYQNLTNLKAYKKGLIEIQDEGAQALSLEIGVKSHDDVFDFCAGAGGKSLIFAQMMQNKGFIQDYDASYKRLSELSKRAKRANVSIIKVVYKLPDAFKKFNHVVVDAPCSGTGTWRRSPDMRFNLTEKQLENIVQKQADILDVAKNYVKAGQYLSYITCSLTRDENEQQIDNFMAKNPDFHIKKQMRYSPFISNTDGFFLCVMQKR